MSQLVLKNILAGSGNVLAGGDNSGNVNKVTIGSNLTLSGGVLSAIGGGSGSVTSVAVSRSGDALSITGSPITTAGTINIGFAGTGAQYIKGDGTLATFPTTISQAQRLITEVYNSTGATLTKGTVVYINGGQGNLPTVTKAQANADNTSAQTYGVVQSDITNMNNGYVVVLGSLTDLDTQAYAVGTQLYLSGTTAGAWTSTKPYAPIHLVYVGIVVRSHPTQGVVEVRIQNGYELDELHDVSAQSPTNGDILQYVAATSLWTKTAGTTTNIAEGTNLYFTNTRARSVLSTNVGSALSYNSTTGRFTLVAAESGIDGYLTGTDWDYFDSKQASLGTGTTSQFLRGDLVWAAPTVPSLDDLTDVVITSPTNGQLLRWQIDHWENWTLPSYVQTTRTLTINGTAYDLSANRTWSVGTITALTGEATASGTGSVAVTLTNSAVIGKVLTGLNVTGGSVAATDSILTAFGKVQNQINGLIGGSIYKGTWNASTNTPALASSVGTAGWYYIVSVAGTTNLNGITDWQLGDWAIFNGGVWQKVDNTDSVVSVNGFTGAVSLTTDNISEGATNLYYTNARARGSVSVDVGSALTYNSTTGRFSLPAADGGVAGYVTTTDYNYWDSKQDSLGTGTTSQWLRGDLTWSTVPAPALEDLTDVTITTPSNGQLLRYQAGTWINFTPTYISLTALSATAPLSYNSTTGVFSISQATTSTNGYLSSTDWNTFNGKQNAITLTTTGTSGAATLVGSTLNIPQYQAVLTNPVTGTGTTNTLPKFTGASAIGDSNITDTGSLITLGSNTTLASGSLGIGTTSLTNYGIRISKNFTGAASGYGVSVDGTIQSDVTTARLNNTAVSTAASAFTLGSLQHYTAASLTIGAGSTVTNQYGFLVLATAIGATNNYAFAGQLAAATNTWNLYMNGTANNYMAGSLGIGQTSLANRGLSVSKNITSGTTSYGITSDGTIQSDVTSSGVYYLSSANTAAASFTLSNLYHYLASQSTIGAGSSVTSQYGYNVSSNLIGATNNYGFYGNIASGTGRWNLYMAGTAANYLAGNIGIGSSPNFVSAGVILTTTLTNGGSGYVDGTYTDVAATNIVSNGVYALFTIVVSGGVVTTATLTWGGTTYRVGDTITVSNTLLGGTGSGLVITVDTVDSSVLTVASTTGGDITLYRNDTSSAVGENIGTIKWESRDSSFKSSGIGAEIGAFSAGSTGGAYLSFFTRSITAGTSLVEAMRIDSRGGVGIGATSLTGISLSVAKNITGSSTSYGIYVNATIQSDVTTAYMNRSLAATAAASFTVSDLIHYNAAQGTIGAGSSVTTQYGFNVSSNLVGATTNYGFFGNIPSGTNRWNLYMNGTASNYLAGKLLIASTTDSGEQLQVTGTAKVSSTLTANSFVKISGTSSQFLKADGTVDSTSYQPFITAGTTAQYYRGDKTFQTLDTSVVPENINLYFTNDRARGAISVDVGSALTYNSTTGRFSLPAATALNDGYLTAADYADFDSKQASLGTGTTSQYLRGDLVWATPPTPTLSDLTDVGITSPTNGQLLRYQLGTWINWTPTYVSAGYFSATAPLAYDSATGIFTITQSSSTVNGYLSSTDWNTFNNKQDALTNPVTGSGASNYIAKWNTASAITNSIIYDNGTRVGINTTNLTSLLDVTKNALGVTVVDNSGLTLKNETEALTGAQQISPALHFESNGWSTTALASQSTDFIMYNLPVQGTSPSNNLIFASSVNGAAYTTRATLTSAGALTITGGLSATTGAFSSTLTAVTTATLTRTGLTTTSTDGVIIQNTTAALVGTQVQRSPRIRLSGTAWNTGTSASNTTNWIIDNLPAAGNPPTSTLTFAYFDTVNATLTNKFTLTNAGAATFTGAISASNLSGTNTGDQTLSGLGGVPTSRTLTINGTTYDLSADRSWTITAGVSGSGTTNYIPKFTGATAIGNSIISESGSAINIAGTAQSSGKVFIQRTAAGADTLLQFKNESGVDRAYIKFGGTNEELAFFSGSGAAQNLAIDSTGNFIFTNNSTSWQEIFYGTSQTNGNCSVFRWKNTGLSIHSFGQAYGTQLVILPSTSNVAIGTTTDAGHKFQVSGTSYFSSTMTIGQTSPNGNANGIYFRPGIESGFIVTSDVALQLSRLVTTGTIQTFYSGSTRVGQIAVTGSSVSFESSLNGGLVVASTGNVGIGTTSPSTKLDVYAGLSGWGSTFYNASSSSVQTFISHGSGYGIAVDSAANTSGIYLLKLASGDGTNRGTNIRFQVNADGNLGIGTSSVTEGTQAAGSISIIPVSSVSSAPLIQFPGNGRIRPASTGDRLSIDGNALYLNSTFGGNVIMATGGGNVLVGTTTDAGYKLDVNGSVRVNTSLRVEGGSGINVFSGGGTGPFTIDYPGVAGGRFNLDNNGALTIRSSMTATAFFESSDKRLKKEISDNPTINIESIKPKLYIKDGKEELGYYAQDLQQILPSSVTEGKDGFLCLSYAQVHTAKIAALENKIEQLEALIKTLIK